MGLQGVRHDLATELNWTELKQIISKILTKFLKYCTKEQKACAYMAAADSVLWYMRSYQDVFFINYSINEMFLSIMTQSFSLGFHSISVYIF